MPNIPTVKNGSNPHLVAALDRHSALMDKWDADGRPISGPTVEASDAAWKEVINAPFADGTHDRPKLGF